MYWENVFFDGILFAIVAILIVIGVSKKKAKNVWLHNIIGNEFLFLRSFPIIVLITASFFAGITWGLLEWRTFIKEKELLIFFTGLSGVLFFIGIVSTYFFKKKLEPSLDWLKENNGKEILYLGFQFCEKDKANEHLWVWEIENNRSQYFLVYANCNKVIKIGSKSLEKLRKFSEEVLPYEKVEKIMNDVGRKFEDIATGVLPKIQFKPHQRSIVDVFFEGIIEYVLDDNRYEEEVKVREIVYKSVYNTMLTIRKV